MVWLYVNNMLFPDVNLGHYHSFQEVIIQILLVPLACQDL